MHEAYSEEYFSKYVAGSLRSARAVLPAVLQVPRMRSILDVGCGWGAWLRVAKELGVRHVRGVDGRHVDRAALLIEEQEFVACELATDWIQNGQPHMSDQFDLTCCLEVAEHLPAEYAAPLVSSLTRTSDMVLFSAAIPFQGGIHHVNEQWPEYWALLFRSHGYLCYDHLRTRFWSDRSVEWWYRQNVLLFVRRDSPAVEQLPPGTTPCRRPLSLVHPLNYVCRATTTPTSHMRRFVSLSDEWLRAASSDNSEVEMSGSRGTTVVTLDDRTLGRVRESRLSGGTDAG